MKKFLLSVFFIGIIGVSFGQILNPVKFSYTAKKKAPNQYEVIVKATIDPKWHLYSIKNPNGGAEPTTLKFEGVTPIGAVKEVGKMKTVFDEAFSVQQKYFENTVDFVQMVKVKPGTKKVSGTIEYMACNDKKCLPPKEVGFEISL
jgi:hypothetical protein